MSNDDQILEEFTSKEYEFGWTVDLEADEAPEQLVVVASDVVHFFAASNHRQQFPHHLHVSWWEVLLFELPNVDDVPVEDQYLGLNGFQVRQYCIGVATAHSQVQV